MAVIEEAERGAMAVGAVHGGAEFSRQERQVAGRPCAVLAEYHQQAVAKFNILVFRCHLLAHW